MCVQEQLNKANDFLSKGDFISGEKIYDDILARDENNVDALFGKAKCYFNRCNYSKALEICDLAREIDSSAVPDEFYNQLLLAVKSNNDYHSRNASHANHSDNVDSKMCPYCGREINPFMVICPFCEFDFRDYDLYEKCENCGRLVDECDAVCANCGEVLKSHESIPEVVRLCDEGFRLIKDYKIKEAKICFNKASKIDSKDATPIVGSAYCLYYLGYYVLALKKCDEALKLDPDSVDDGFYNDVNDKVNSVKS